MKHTAKQGIWITKGEEVVSMLDDDSTTEEKESLPVLILADSSVISMLKKGGTRSIALITPDVSRYVREMTKYGVVGMGIRKLKSLGVVNLLRLLPRAVRALPGVRSNNFRKILPVLMYIEFLETKKLDVEYIFLHSNITDLALTTNNSELIRVFLSSVPNTVHVGLMTKNLTLLDQRLRQWGFAVTFVLAPFAANGYGMRESQRACEKIVAQAERVYFSFAVCTEEQLDGEMKYLDKLGVVRGYFSARKV